MARRGTNVASAELGSEAAGPLTSEPGSWRELPLLRAKAQLAARDPRSFQAPGPAASALPQLGEREAPQPGESRVGSLDRGSGHPGEPGAGVVAARTAETSAFAATREKPRRASPAPALRVRGHRRTRREVSPSSLGFGEARPSSPASGRPSEPSQPRDARGRHRDSAQHHGSQVSAPWPQLGAIRNPAGAGSPVGEHGGRTVGGATAPPAREPSSGVVPAGGSGEARAAGLKGPGSLGALRTRRSRGKGRGRLGPQEAQGGGVAGGTPAWSASGPGRGGKLTPGRGQRLRCAEVGGGGGLPPALTWGLDPDSI